MNGGRTIPKAGRNDSLAYRLDLAAGPGAAPGNHASGIAGGRCGGALLPTGRAADDDVHGLAGEQEATLEHEVGMPMRGLE